MVRERVSRGPGEGVMRRSGREIERGLMMMTDEDLKETRRARKRDEGARFKGRLRGC